MGRKHDDRIQETTMGRMKNGRVGFSKKAEKTPTIVEGDVVGVTDSEDVTMAENENKVNGQEDQ